MRLILIAAAYDWIFSAWYFPFAVYERIIYAHILDEEDATEPLSVRSRN